MFAKIFLIIQNEIHVILEKTRVNKIVAVILMIQITFCNLNYMPSVLYILLPF